MVYDPAQDKPQAEPDAIIGVWTDKNRKRFDPTGPTASIEEFQLHFPGRDPVWASDIEIKQ